MSKYIFQEKQKIFFRIIFLKMSVYIPLKYLTSDNQKDIAKKLHIKDSTFVFNKNAFSGEDNTKSISCLKK